MKIVTQNEVPQSDVMWMERIGKVQGFGEDECTLESLGIK